MQLATSIVHSKLDYCNSVYYNLPKSQITRLQLIQNSIACVVVKAPKSCHITPILCSLHWLKITECIEYILLSLTYKVLITTQTSISAQPQNLFNLLAVFAPHFWLPSLDHQHHARYVLRITDRLFRCASPCLRNQLPSSLRQPHSSLSVSCSCSCHIFLFSQLSTLTIRNSLSLSLPAQDLPFSQMFPTIDSLPASGLTPRLYDWSVSSEHLGFYF